MDILNRLKKTETKEDFIFFVQLLAKDFVNNNNQWKNDDIYSYLEAISGWTMDIEGYYKNKGEDFNEEFNWRIMAEILYAAKMYE